MDQVLKVRAILRNAWAVDGDTVDCTIEVYLPDFGVSVALDNQRIRLLGIDTPERGQENYQEAKLHLHSLLNQEEHIYFTVGEKKKDSFGRWLGYIYGKDGVSLNQKMMISGYADEYKA